MVSFRYRARDARGAVVDGEVDAGDRRGALEVLARRGLFPSRLDAIEAGASDGEAFRGAAVMAPEPSPRRGARDGSSERPARPLGRIARKQITVLTRELATLLAAEIPIPRALEGLAEEEESEAVRALLIDVAARVRSGSSLSEALSRYPRQFSTLYCSMVAVGEEAGQLAAVLEDLAQLLEREDEIRGEVVGAIAYPLFVLGMGVATTFVLLAFVLPRLFGMLEEMTDVLPLPTTILLAVSEFFENWWAAVLIVGVALFLTARWYARSADGGPRVDAWKLRIPVLGAVYRAAALGRFSRTLGTLVRAGVSLLPALEIVRNTVGNRHVAGLLGKVAEDTRGGDSLAAPLRKLGLFPATMIQMIAVGEETGRLDAMLLQVAVLQERLVRGRSKAVVSLLAPGLILVVGALIGFVVIALLLPIFRMSQSLR